VNDLLGPLKLGILFKNVIFRVIGFGLGGIFLIVTGYLGWRYYKLRKNENKEGLQDQLI
jgi:hypothetical protein